MKYKGFTIVPDFIVQEYGAVAGLIFGKIARYCEWSDMNVCTASNQRLATELGMGESTIRKWKDILEEKGYLKVTGKVGFTDSVAVIAEMVMQMEGSLQDSAPPATEQRPPPLQDSDKEYIKNTKDTSAPAVKGDLLDGILASQGEEPSLVRIPVDCVDFYREFCHVSNMQATKPETSDWIKTFREWVQLGVKTSDISKMYQYARDNDWGIARPGSVTKAYRMMKNKPSTVEKLSKQRAREEASFK